MREKNNWAVTINDVGGEKVDVDSWNNTGDKVQVLDLSEWRVKVVVAWTLTGRGATWSNPGGEEDVSGGQRRAVVRTVEKVGHNKMNKQRVMVTCGKNQACRYNRQ